MAAAWATAGRCRRCPSPTSPTSTSAGRRSCARWRPSDATRPASPSLLRSRPARTRRVAPRRASWHSRSSGRGDPRRSSACRPPGTGRAAAVARRGRRAAPRGPRVIDVAAAAPGPRHDGRRRAGHDGAVTDAPDGTDPNPPKAGSATCRPSPSGSSPRSRRGLASAYIPGGDDPDPERTRREEAPLRPAARDHGRRDRGQRPARDIRRARARRAGAVTAP